MLALTDVNIHLRYWKIFLDNFIVSCTVGGFCCEILLEKESKHGQNFDVSFSHASALCPLENISLVSHEDHALINSNNFTKNLAFTFQNLKNSNARQLCPSGFYRADLKRISPPGTSRADNNSASKWIERTVHNSLRANWDISSITLTIIYSFYPLFYFNWGHKGTFQGIREL